jgi:hypothetical protein
MMHGQQNNTKKYHLSILDAQSFMGADCYTDHYLEVVKLRKDWQYVNKWHGSLMWRNIIAGS